VVYFYKSFLARRKDLLYNFLIMRKEILKEIITDFQERPLPDIKSRVLKIPINTEKIVTIVGVRRSGKTYHLYKLIDQLCKKGVSIENIIYINFEDERINPSDFSLDIIIQSCREMHPNKNVADFYFFFDEIQVIPNWEKFVRRVYDTITRNIFISGSNSKLLSREIATALRGRTITYEVFPLSFREYLSFFDISINLGSSKTRAKVISYFENFLVNGGFPEIYHNDKDVRNLILQEYFNVMLFKDIVERYGVSQPAILKYFCKRALGNSAKEFSVHKIYNEIKSQGYKISKDTLYEFQDYIESIYLVLFLKKFEYSTVKSEFAQKKAYSIDNGLAGAVNSKFSQDKGRQLENLMFLEFTKSGKEVFYYKNGYECNFIIKGVDNIIEAVQVCVDISDKNVFDRKVNGLVATCKKLNLTQGYIVSLEDEDKINVEGIAIEIIPAYKYLLKKI